MVFFLTIAIAVIVNIYFISTSVENNQHYGRIINLSGRQRYLSQQNTSSVLLQSIGKPESQKLNQNLIIWNDIHNALQYGNPQYNIYKADKQHKDRFKTINPIQKHLLDIISQAQKKSIDQKLLDELLQYQHQYIVEMDKIVFSYQVDAEHALSEIQQKQIWAALFSGILLISEIIFLVIPFHKKLITAYRDLKNNKHTIQTQSDEIRTQLDQLTTQRNELEKIYLSKDLTLDGINAGIWNWDIITGEENWSQNFYHILGYDVGEIPAKYDTFIHFLLHPDDRQLVEEAIRLHLEEGKKYHVNIRMLTKYKGYRWFDASGLASRDENGNPIQMAGSIIDIDDTVLYKKQIETSNHAKDKIFAILSHDLRAPLIGIKGLLDLQTEGEISEQNFKEYIHLMHDGISNALKTLDNVLLWSSTQMNSSKVEATSFRLKNIFLDVEQFHKYFSQQKEIQLSYHVDDFLYGHADPNHIFIITRNLVGNAIKFTPKGGLVKVTAHLKENRIEVSVEDNGVGMDPLFVEKILNRNNYDSTYGTEREKGTGLGVNLVLDLLERNNGKLWIESTQGIGSRFTYTIPTS